MEISSHYYAITVNVTGLRAKDVTGFSRVPVLEIKEGFAILRDEKQTTVIGIPLASIISYEIQPRLRADDATSDNSIS